MTESGRRTSDWLLLALTCLLSLLVLEGGLRLLLDPDQLIPNEPAHPALNERRNELRFYAENAHRKPTDFRPHDPWLGWDTRHGVRGLETVPPKSGFRAVAMGDSFVFGNEVAPDENFVALLDRADNGLEVLNLGVPGYGIDQSWLKYERHGAGLNPDVVLFGIYVSDYERATVAFTAGAKPCFRVQGGEVVLTNQPVPGPAESIERIRSSLRGRSYLLDFLRYRIAALSDGSAGFFADGDRVISHVLKSLRTSVGSERRLLIVHIPRGESFTAPDPFGSAMDRHLLALYEALDLPHVDLREEFLSLEPGERVADAFYVVRESGSVGHLNPEGHRVAAQAIARHLALPVP